MSSSSWPSAVCASPTRASAGGAGNLAWSSPSDCAGAVLGRAISGTWTKCSSESMVSCTISGGRSTKHGVVLDILVQDRRNATAAKRFFKRLLQGLQYKPRRLITDGLRSYGVAHCALLTDV